jgi:hypothetical protein
MLSKKETFDKRILIKKVQHFVFTGPTVEVSDSDRVVHEQQVQIKELQDQLEALKVKNEHMSAKMVELEKKQAAPEDLLSNFFSKALKLRFSCGKTGYENLLSLGYPLRQSGPFRNELNIWKLEVASLVRCLKPCPTKLQP